MLMGYTRTRSRSVYSQSQLQLIRWLFISRLVGSIQGDLLPFEVESDFMNDPWDADKTRQNFASIQVDPVI